MNPKTKCDYHEMSHETYLHACQPNYYSNLHVTLCVNPNRDSPNGYLTVTPTELQPVTLAH